MLSIGHNPDKTIIGTKAADSNNSVIAIVSAKDQRDEISSVEFVCTFQSLDMIEEDIVSVGYKLQNTKKYIEDKRLKIKEVTYIRVWGNHNDFVTIKYLLTRDWQDIQGARIKFIRKTRIMKR